MSSTRISGLTDHEAFKARNLGLNAIALLLAHPQQVHYSQGANRWEGIDHHMLASEGKYPSHSDCSSSASWIVWNALHPFTHKDTVNGTAWKWGYTGTILKTGRPVKHQYSWKVLDLLVYGVPGTTGEHVAVYLGGGKVFSHGSEGGPYKPYWNYRNDLMAVRRPI